MDSVLDAVVHIKELSVTQKGIQIMKRIDGASIAWVIICLVVLFLICGALVWSVVVTTQDVGAKKTENTSIKGATVWREEVDGMPCVLFQRTIGGDITIGGITCKWDEWKGSLNEQ